MKFGRLLLGAALALGIGSTAAKAEDFTGFYFGVLGGGSFVGAGGECFFCVGAPGVAKVVGYNWDDGSVIYGIEKMVVITTFEGYLKISWQGAGRIGTHIGDDAMLYGSGGVGVSHIPEGPLTIGYAHVGGGVEVPLSDNLSLRSHVQLSFPFEPEWWNEGLTPVKSIATGFVWQLD